MPNKLLKATEVQESICFHQMMDPDTPFYQIPMALLLKGSINIKILEESINKLVTMQPSLRSNFTQKNNTIYQIIKDNFTIKTSYVDLSSHKEIKDPKRTAISLIRRDSLRKRSLETDKLFFSNVYKISSNEFLLATSMHHIITDGFSWGLFFEELFTIYNEKLNNVKTCFDNPREIRDSIEKDSEDIKESIDFHTNNCRNLPILDMRTNKKLASNVNFNGDTVTSEINHSIQESITRLSMETGLTKAMICLASFQITLYYLSKKDDFGIGFPIENRHSEKIRKSIGCFINTLIYRAKTNKKDTIENILENTQDQLLDLLTYGDEPLANVINNSNMERSPQFNPGFQVMYIFQSLPFHESETISSNITSTHIPINLGLSIFDITFEIRQTSKHHLYLFINYKSDLYSREFISNLCSCFLYVLSFMRKKNISSTVGDLFSEMNEYLHIQIKEKTEFEPSKLDTLSEKENETETESVIIRIWKELLNREDINRKSNFFHSSGNSIIALKIISQIKNCLGCDISFKEFFSNPVILNLSSLIDQKKEKTLTSENLKIIKKYKNKPLVSSFSQEQLWFLWKINPQGTAYNVSGILSFSNKIESYLIESILTQIINRHDTLRSAFFEKDGSCYQRILPHIEKTKITEQYVDSMDTVRQLCISLSKKIFNLDKGYLFRFLHFKSKNQSHLFISMHHIIFDGWSLNVFMKEFKHYYSLHKENKPDKRPDLPIQYHDYAAWQKDNYAELFSKKIEFWCTYLNGIKPLNILTDKKRSKIQHGIGKKEKILISEKLSSQLRSFSDTNGVSIFQTLLTGYLILLKSLTAHEDISVAAPYLARDSNQTEDLIGLFVTNTIIRLKINSSMTIMELIKKVHESSINALNHSGVPYELLVRNICKERDLSQNPLAQVAFNLVNTFDPKFSLTKDLTIEMKTIDSGGSKYDLSLMVIDYGTHFSCELEYDTELFFDESIRQYLNYYHSILEGMTLHQNEKIFQAPYSDKALIKSINSKETNPDDFCSTSIIYHFENQASKRGELPAICDNQKTISYKKLSRESCYLEKEIFTKSKRNNQRVAIIGDHNTDTITAILAVLKNKSAYIPLNPHYPTSWIYDVLKKTRANTILLNKHTLAKHRHLSKITDDYLFMDIDSNWLICDRKIEDSGLEKNNKNAYILCTSGSTGQKKFIPKTHQGVLKHIKNYISSIEINKKTKLLQTASLSHDASVMDLFSTLLSGGCLYCVDLKECGKEEIHTISTSFKPNTIHMTPSIFKILTEDNAHISGFSHVEKIILGGEEVSKDVVHTFNQNFTSQTTLYNLYGSTEYSFSFLGKFNHPVSTQYRTLPIGHPLPDTNTIIIDPLGEHSPFFGELAHINSDGEIEKSGDVFRVLPDDSYLFIERLNNIINVRGHRVHLKQIEDCVKSQDNVTDAAITTKELNNGDSTLLCFLTVSDRTETDRILSDKIRRKMSEELPSYMIPNLIYILDKIPITENGKIDFNTLKSKEDTEHTQENKGDSRHDCPTFNLIKTVWESVLKRKITNSAETFFNLGGHSLLLIDLQNKIFIATGVKIPLTDFFQNSTIDSICRFINNKHFNSSRNNPDSNNIKEQRKSIILNRKLKREHTHE